MSPATTQFKLALSSVDIAALKSQIETGYYGVGLNYSGNEFDYACILQGPIFKVKKAMNAIMPVHRNDIIT